jgi:hypothetical protein
LNTVQRLAGKLFYPGDHEHIEPEPPKSLICDPGRRHDHADLGRLFGGVDDAAMTDTLMRVIPGHPAPVAIFARMSAKSGSARMSRLAYARVCMNSLFIPRSALAY